MGASSKIGWTDATFNGWWGCEKVSPGCTNCYAEAFAKRTGHDVWGKGGARRVFGDKHWDELLKWNLQAQDEQRQRLVFCSSMADVFEDHPIAEELRPRLWSYVARTPWLIYQLLTKRPENVERMTPWGAEWPNNVWLGVTVEDQERRVRLDRLRFIEGPVIKFASCEPLLEDLGDVDFTGIDWAIFGGESGGGKRVRHLALEWIRNGVARARAAGAAPFVKQLGSKPVDGLEPTGEFRTHEGRRQFQMTASLLKLIDRKGSDPAEWPEDLRVQEFPIERPPAREARS
jgi:protein gp37